MARYLDETGLSILWERIEQLVAEQGSGYSCYEGTSLVYFGFIVSGETYTLDINVFDNVIQIEIDDVAYRVERQVHNNILEYSGEDNGVHFSWSSPDGLTWTWTYGNEQRKDVGISNYKLYADTTECFRAAVQEAVAQKLFSEIRILENFEMVNARSKQDIYVGNVKGEGWNILSVQQVYESGSTGTASYAIDDGYITSVYPNAFLSAPNNEGMRTVGVSVYNPGNATVKIIGRVILACFS